VSLTPGGASPKMTKRVKNKALRDFVTSQPLCDICGLPAPPNNPFAPHHLKRVGAGGVDENNMITVHWYECHVFAHTYGFKQTDELSREVGKDLLARAKQLTDEFNKTQGSK